ncbi:MAG TPA: acetoin utilization protein AcuC [Thermodesulfobacteriota bacterium]|nr:acetoin utilization protein AcuC [Thermodesulfobacteriota bacterium]
MKTALIYTDAYLDYDYGPTHPLQVIRLKLTYDLLKSYGLLDLPSVQFISTIKAEEEDLAAFHSEEYLNILRQADNGHLSGNAFSYGLGPGDNPIFPGIYDWSLLVTGATLQAVEFVAEGKGEIAFNIAGGLHHAMKARASGFCYINDPVIGIMRLLSLGKRVAYIDIDVHHGDGVQEAFYDTNQVLTISLHETGYTLFPGTGFEHEIGKGEGEGYCVNLPFPPCTDDEVYSWAFEEVVPGLVQAFKPDVVVTQLGVDTFYNDPLANLHLSIYGYERVLKRIKDLAPRWVALGGGGYNISNVARAWTLAWAVMNGIELDEELPESFLKEATKIGFEAGELKGSLRPPRHSQNEEAQTEMERVVRYIKETVLPKIEGGSCSTP